MRSSVRCRRFSKRARSLAVALATEYATATPVSPRVAARTRIGRQGRIADRGLISTNPLKQPSLPGERSRPDRRSSEGESLGVRNMIDPVCYYFVYKIYDSVKRRWLCCWGSRIHGRGVRTGPQWIAGKERRERGGIVQKLSSVAQKCRIGVEHPRALALN